MKTQYYTASSLDGFIADEHNSLEWLFQFGDDTAGNYAEFISNVGAVAMGSTTYEWMLEHAIKQGTDHEQPWPYSQPTWVFSSRELPRIGGVDINFVRGDVRPAYAEMRAAAGDRNIWVVGGGELAGQFFDHGLLDEIIVTFASVTLGKGAPLLPRRIVTPPLRLVSVKAFGEAYAHLTYAVQKPSPASAGTALPSFAAPRSQGSQ